MRSKTNAATARQKLSTTVSSETHRYLASLVRTGRANTFAEAVDLVVRRAQRAERRSRLERDTAAYFGKLPARAAHEEARLEAALSQSTGEVSFDE